MFSVLRIHVFFSYITPKVEDMPPLKDPFYSTLPYEQSPSSFLQPLYYAHYYPGTRTCLSYCFLEPKHDVTIAMNPAK
jgi:hypothetical protein